MKNLTMPWHTLALSGIMTAMLGITGCSQPAEEEAAVDPVETEAPTTTSTTSDKSIRIATEGAYPPFNYTTNDGELAGYDVDVANALCEQMQADCTIVAQEWEGIIPGLLTKKYDAIIAGMEITEERQESVDFSEPYFVTSMVWIAKDDGSFDPNNVVDNKLGGQRSTTLADYLIENFDGKNGNTVNLYDTYDNAYLDLKSGRNDAVLSDKVPAFTWLKDNPEYAMVGDSVGPEGQFAIAVRKNDPLKAELDTALQAIRDSGEFDRIEAEYFGQ